MRLFLRATMALFGLLSSGCATLEARSSGHIGCPESDITISDEEDGWNSKTWKAHCHGKTFFCSAVSGTHHTQVACKEPPGDAPVAPGGCQYDTQCKGARVCRQGQCTDP